MSYQPARALLKMIGWEPAVFWTNKMLKIQPGGTGQQTKPVLLRRDDLLNRFLIRAPDARG
ncbi:MAG TPA: hypothetical protein VK249_02095, partial [Anaerolineales bacterium]|nr:hypothetical protein [Anaerolineales bacterium]